MSTARAIAMNKAGEIVTIGSLAEYNHDQGLGDHRCCGKRCSKGGFMEWRITAATPFERLEAAAR